MSLVTAASSWANDHGCQKPLRILGHAERPRGLDQNERPLGSVVMIRREFHFDLEFLKEQKPYIDEESSKKIIWRISLGQAGPFDQMIQGSHFEMKTDLARVVFKTEIDGYSATVESSTPLSTPNAWTQIEIAARELALTREHLFSFIQTVSAVEK